MNSNSIKEDVDHILRHLGELLDAPIDQLLATRYERYRRFGSFLAGDGGPS